MILQALKQNMMGTHSINREYVYQKYLTRLGWLVGLGFDATLIANNEVSRTDNFRALARKLSFLPTELDMSFIISNAVKHELSSIWKQISCSYNVMDRVDCVIKRDVYLQKVHSCSKNIRGISVFFLNIPGVCVGVGG